MVSGVRRRLAPATIVLAAALLAACGGSKQAAETPAPVAPATTAADAPSAEPGTTADAGQTGAAAGCTREEFPSQGRNHVQTLPEGFEYNSFPATSGPHAAPVIWNAYTEPLPAVNLVHNLEHGGIVVQFGPDVPEDDLRAVVDWYVADPVGLVLAPLPELGDKIAVAAWTHLLTCDGFDEEEFTSFRDELRFRGPELIPPQNLQPGM
jgi:Protein of unknown function (DUF3105)